MARRVKRKRGRRLEEMSGAMMMAPPVVTPVGLGVPSAEAGNLLGGGALGGRRKGKGHHMGRGGGGKGVGGGVGGGAVHAPRAPRAAAAPAAGGGEVRPIVAGQISYQQTKTGVLGGTKKKIKGRRRGR